MNNLDITHFLGRLLVEPLFDTPPEQNRNWLRKSLEWEKIIEVASENLITPALYSSFCSLNAFHALPDDLQGYLTEIHLCNAQRNLEIKEQVLQIASCLNKIGVEPVFLKGVANLFYEIYPDPADRIMSDADILVPKEKLLECVQILKGEDYYSVYDESLFNEKSHHYFPLISDRKQASVELHQYSVPKPYTCLYSEEEFWASSMVKSVKNTSFRLPSPMDHIKHHIIHAHKHFGVYGMGKYLLRGLYDFALICRMFKGQIHWSLLDNSFNKAGFRKAFVSYLLAADKFCGYQDPLHHVETKNTERLYAHRVNLHFKYPGLFALWKILSEYKRSYSEIASDHERRKEFLKKLKSRQIYVRHAKIIVGCFSQD
jgi:hypothetical protein